MWNLPPRAISWTALPLFLLALLLMGLPSRAYAQVARSLAPNAQADEVFERAVDAFEAGNYDLAERRFEEAWQRYPVHLRTTAAALMQGKALYRAERYREAIEAMDRFLEAYPTSRYVESARRTRGFARTYLAAQDADARLVRLGVALPTEGEDARLARAFFNGLRLAVDEHNLNTAEPVQMVFRPTGSNRATEQALLELSREGVDAVIGPLFTEEAEVAARTAERERLPLVVPLDASEDLTAGRQWVYQVNPNITARGGLMARFAQRNLGLNTFAALAESGNDLSERMAAGFRQEALGEGGAVALYATLEPRAWSRLPDEVEAGVLASAEALYVPLVSRDAIAKVDAVLQGLTRMGLGLPSPDASAPRVRLLGDEAWHDLPMAALASEFAATYGLVFDPQDGPALQRIRSGYRALAGDDLPASLERLVITAYDTATYLMEQLTLSSDEALPDRIRRAAPFEGAGIRIHFESERVNQGLYVYRYRFGRQERLR